MNHTTTPICGISGVYPACKSGRSLSQKIYLELTPPSDSDTMGDADRLQNALDALSLKDRSLFSEQARPFFSLPYPVLVRDYPSFRQKDWKITVTLVYTGRNWEITSIEAGDTAGSHYGLAADLGSTTVAMALMNLNTGEILAEESCFNRQISFGEDILSRIFYTRSSPEHRKELQQATVDSLVFLMKELEKKSGISVSECPVMVIGGNTTMIHFLLDIDAFPIFMSPFAPVFNQTGFLPGREFTLPFSGLVYCLPSSANYLGGDIISGLLAVGMAEDSHISLYIDIGTNGEMVIGSSEFLVAGAGAAGPALEGGISRFGMRADTGAIDSVRIADGALTVTVIGNGPAKGICGSGIVDLLAQLLLNGWMDLQGNLLMGSSDRIVLKDEEAAVVYAWGKDSETGEDLYFSQMDIDSFLDTKAAASTMVSCLLEETGISTEDIERIYTAGSFGKYLDLESAITIGLYPDLPRERFSCVGNGSLKGACSLLADRRLVNQISHILPNIHYIQFGMAEDFVTKMRAARFFPHTDLDCYPTVKRELQKRHILPAE